MLRTYKYRLYPAPKQEVRLYNALGLCRKLYNASLNQRIYSHQRNLCVGYNSQAMDLPILKNEFPEYKEVHSQVLQDVLKRLDKSFSNFFRRVKEKQSGKCVKSGFPRFKGKNRFRSITYPQDGYEILNVTHLKVSKFGILRFFQHRPIPKGGTIKTMSIKHDLCGDWFVSFSVKLPDPEPVKNPTKKVGVDVGLKQLAVLSSGDVFAPKKFLRINEAKIKRLQRSVSRKTKGSNRRKKAVVRLARAHRHIQRCRDDYLHKVSRALVNSNDCIVFENLNINNMVRNHYLAKSIIDAAWGKLKQFTTYKAESAGKVVLVVDPKYTSQTCHKCGARKQISLSVRTFHCDECGHSYDRDWNAAVNIDKRIGPDWVELFKNARRVDPSTWMYPIQARVGNETGSPYF